MLVIVQTNFYNSPTFAQHPPLRKQGLVAVLRSKDICHLALISMTLARMPITSIALVDWDLDDTANSQEWRDVVDRERKFTSPPPWDPHWRITWFTQAEWLNAPNLLENGIF